MTKAQSKRTLACKAGMLALIVVAWVVLDRVTKELFTGMAPGARLGDGFGGIVDFVLVHNTGAAWGVFSDSTVALGVFSLIVVAVLLGYFIVSIRSVTYLQTASIALIVAGGIGNAIDRFSQGYVTDFIAVTFIDFPVFNVADIGVTCGVILLFASIIASWRSESAALE